MPKCYQGSCQCGAIKYEAEIDTSAGAEKCSYPVYTGIGVWSVPIRPSCFRLLSEASALSDYHVAAKGWHHLFCKFCSEHCFTRGYVDPAGAHFVMVQRTTIRSMR